MLVADAMSAAKAKPAASADIVKVLARKAKRLEKKFVAKQRRARPQLLLGLRPRLGA